VNGETALGLLEVHGLAAAIAVADEMAKAAPVELLRRQEIGDGLVTVVARGGVSAVQEAIAVGRRVATGHASLRAATVLGRPAAGVEDLFFPITAGAPGRGGVAPPSRVRTRAAVNRNRAGRTKPAQIKSQGGNTSG
jgi:ethanolamine utilization protein EutM